MLPDLPKGEDEILAVGGKTARASAHAGLAALHTVSVWSSQFELVVGQENVADKSNEIVVIPGLLEVVAAALARAKPDPSGSSAARW